LSSLNDPIILNGNAVRASIADSMICCAVVRVEDCA